ncbi:MAG: helix-turn-helix domain-containing protein [Firmicutes bacterium]|nr:helix-turn-helix domain-containing protein [Bacillota bacterium]MDH7495653.1 helix-turn-helix domain-containing protein [Bacillota bacterium]
MRELGELLRKAREAKGLTISDVQEATKIRGRYLEAIEQGELEVLPGEVYVRGFLRNYAEAVGLRGDEIVERYKAARSQVAEGKAPETSFEKGQDVSAKLRMSRHWMVAGGIMAAVVILAGAVVLRYVRPPADLAGRPGASRSSHLQLNGLNGDVAASGALASSEGQISAETRPDGMPAEAGQDSTGQIAGQPAQVTPFPQGSDSQSGGVEARSALREPQEASRTTAGHELSVHVTERCWVRVVADGKVVFERSMLAGERATWQAAESLRIKVGNASGIDVTYNGVHIGALGRSGQVVERTFPED